MIPADDPRHGQTRGYHAGCREDCCKRAILRDEKRRRLERLQGVTRAIPAIGAQRRIQALMRLGYTCEDIAAAAGWPHRNRVLRILNGQKGKPTKWLERATHDKVCRVYDQLSMRLPEMTPYRKRGRTMAERKGYAPPLAWDDIDNDPAPMGGRYQEHRPKTEVDEAVVLRLLDGERIDCTTAERDEAMRRWKAAGKPERQLCAMHGWQERRYGRREVAA